MSSRRHAQRRRRTAAIVSAGLALTSAVLIPETAAHAATTSPLQLRVPAQMTGSVYDDRDGSTSTSIDSALYLQANGQNFELRSHRSADYASAITTQLRRGSTTKDLPAGTTDSLAGLSDFLDVTVHNSKGQVVYRKSPTVCLNSYDTAKTAPDAAAHSDYPEVCGDNPFARGSVQGIARGWATRIDPFYDASDPEMYSVPFGVGTYHVDVAVNAKYRSLFGIAAKDGRGSSTLTVSKETDEGPFPATRRLATKAAAAPKTRTPQGVKLAATPASGPRPDLAALPAWGIEIDQDDPNYLDFAATVWNAGTSPLVVDGFRKGNADVMGAYQYFYDTSGKQTGYVRAGSMEWDGRPSHNHWHFSDFARYSLLDATKKTAVVSEKEAFCLANTDAIDYTIKAANWHPDNTDLRTACGDHSSIAVSEVLATGSGDTYSQVRAGQSFPLAKLKNGTYYIKVEANPDNVLTELGKGNNVALRKITIGGTAGHRTVYAYPVGDVTS